jgi:hypothetical protein
MNDIIGTQKNVKDTLPQIETEGMRDQPPYNLRYTKI